MPGRNDDWITHTFRYGGAALTMQTVRNLSLIHIFIQKADASTIGDLAKAVQQLFGDTGTHIIGTRHGEKLFETLMTREAVSYTHLCGMPVWAGI